MQNISFISTACDDKHTLNKSSDLPVILITTGFNDCGLGEINSITQAGSQFLASESGAHFLLLDF